MLNEVTTSIKSFNKSKFEISSTPAIKRPIKVLTFGGLSCHDYLFGRYSDTLQTLISASNIIFLSSSLLGYGPNLLVVNKSLMNNTPKQIVIEKIVTVHGIAGIINRLFGILYL